MKKYFIVLILVSIGLFTFDASVFYSEKSAFLFNDDNQALIHFAFFAAFAAFTKNLKLSIIASISLELMQFFVEARAFQMIDLLSNTVAVLVAEKFIKK
jgi:glycopeptide antibiotics resistance protein